VRYSRELREFLTGEKLDQETVDHLEGYTKQLKGKYEKFKDNNKIYTNIMYVASVLGGAAGAGGVTSQSENEPVPLNLEAEYKSSVVEVAKQLSLSLDSLKANMSTLSSIYSKDHSLFT
jgi:hypothetical protein